MTRKLLLALIFVSITGFAEPSPQQAFIDMMVSQHHFDRQQLTTLFNSLKPNQTIIKTMNKPFEAQPWSYYRNHFITDRRIQLGTAYLKKHHKQLLQLQAKYGIPPSIITAIIGVETEYGLHLGKYSVLDALYTLGFYYPPRETFFKKELAQYLILTRDNHLPVHSIKGSYAGALGIPQFMPSSYRSYGVSTEKNNRVDLFDHADAIASVANYFHHNGWQPNQPIAYQMASKGDALKNDTTLITLPMGKNDEYWAIYHNFDVIMRYNHNVVYAMAVYQLSQAIEQAYENERSA